MNTLAQIAHQDVTWRLLLGLLVFSRYRITFCRTYWSLHDNDLIWQSLCNFSLFVNRNIDYICSNRKLIFAIEKTQKPKLKRIRLAVLLGLTLIKLLRFPARVVLHIWMSDKALWPVRSLTTKVQIQLHFYNTIF